MTCPGRAKLVSRSCHTEVVVVNVLSAVQSPSCLLACEHDCDHSNPPSLTFTTVCCTHGLFTQTRSNTH